MFSRRFRWQPYGMKKIVLALGAASIATAAYARSDTDYPHRDWGKAATLNMSLADATACIAREMGRRGGIVVIPADGGNDIDYSARTGFGGTVDEPWMRFKLSAEGDITGLRVFYRHPVTRRRIGKDVARMQEYCLKVVSITAALPDKTE